MAGLRWHDWLLSVGQNGCFYSSANNFPKGTGFSAVSDEEVERVYDAINRRPHKRLGFRTPYEVHYSGVLQLL